MVLNKLKLFVYIAYMPMLAACVAPLIEGKPDAWGEIDRERSEQLDFSGRYANIATSDHNECLSKRDDTVHRDCVLSVLFERIHDRSYIPAVRLPQPEYQEMEVLIGRNTNGLVPVRVTRNGTPLNQYVFDVDKYYRDQDFSDSKVLQYYWEDIGGYLFGEGRITYLLRRGTDDSIILHRIADNVDVWLWPPGAIGSITDTWYKWRSVK